MVLAKERCCHKMAQLAAMLAEMALTAVQHCHEAATWEKALANEPNKQHCHETAAQEKTLVDDAESQHCPELAACAEALAELVSAVEQSCQELADRPAVLAETTLTDERCRQKEAEHGAMLEKMALAAEQRRSLSAVQASELALATARVAVLVDLLLPEPALAKDKRRQEETTKKQCRADDKRVMVPVLLPNLGNTAIQCIWVECTLLAAPLDAILAKIECNGITHEAQAPLTTTSPHPAAILSTPPCPMTYVGVVLSTMGGSTCVASLGLAPPAIPLPIIDGQLRILRQCAQTCCCTGCCHRPRLPSPPDKVLPSQLHPTLGGLPMPTKTLTTLAQATSPCCSVVLSPPTFLTTSPTPSLLPFTFSSKVLLSSGGGTAHPFCVGNPPPQKRTQRKHQPCHACQCHGLWAPNPQEHLLCGRRHWPRTPNQ
jgi:hypothetical protein